MRGVEREKQAASRGANIKLAQGAAAATATASTGGCCPQAIGSSGQIIQPGSHLICSGLAERLLDGLDDVIHHREAGRLQVRGIGRGALGACE